MVSVEFTKKWLASNTGQLREIMLKKVRYLFGLPFFQQELLELYGLKIGHLATAPVGEGWGKGIAEERRGESMGHQTLAEDEREAAHPPPPPKKQLAASSCSLTRQLAKLPPPTPTAASQLVEKKKCIHCSSGRMIFGNLNRRLISKIEFQFLAPYLTGKIFINRNYTLIKQNIGYDFLQVLNCILDLMVV